MNTSSLRELARIHQSTDYGSKLSVQEGNIAADKIRQLILEAASSGKTSELIELLADPEIGPWIAYTSIECSGFNDIQRVQCIKLIERISSGIGTESTAAKIWLKQHGTSS